MPALCALLSSCALQGGNAGESDAWRCTPIDPGQGGLPPTPCFRAALADTNLITLQWRVSNSRPLVYLADDLGPPYNDPGPAPAYCPQRETGICQWTTRVSSGGAHRWQLQVTGEDGATLHANASLSVPAPFPPAVSGGGAIDPLSPQEQVITWQADLRNAPEEARPKQAWVTVRDAATGKWQPFDFRPRSGPDANYVVAPEIFRDREVLQVHVRDCRRVLYSGTKICSDPVPVNFPIGGDQFLHHNPLYIDAGEDLVLQFTTRAGELRRFRSDTLLPGGEISTSATELIIDAARLPAGEHAISLASCLSEGDHCTGERRLRVIVGGNIDWELDRDYEQDFWPGRARRLTGSGIPLSTRYDAAGNIWTINEFANSLEFASREGGSTSYSVPLARQSPFNSARQLPVKPFTMAGGRGQQVSVSHSALAEHLALIEGELWFAQGGGLRVDTAAPQDNRSRIVNFDPRAQDDPRTAHDDRFCVRTVPAPQDNVMGNNQVVGLVSSGGRIWISELRDFFGQGPGALSSFVPASIPCEDPSDASTANYCEAGQTPGEDSCWANYVIDGAKPAMLEVDPQDQSIWFTDAHGRHLGNLDPRREPAVVLHPLPDVTVRMVNGKPRTGDFPWALRVTDAAVYFAEYRTRQVLRFDKAGKNFEEISVPSRSPTAAMLHSIEIDPLNNRLWFTLTNEPHVPWDPQASTIGYVDLASWEARAATQGAQHVRGVIYRGLDRIPQDEREAPWHQSFHGIALHPASGRLTMATLWRHAATEITPRPAFYPQGQ